jgi:6-phosphogluconolactonase (cycloisomerase 2 family)
MSNHGGNMNSNRFRAQVSVLLSFASLVVAACGGSGGGGTTYPISGQALKGPFAIGSQISVNEQNPNLSPTGKVYNVETSDYLGNFSVASGVGTNLVEIVADGFYMDDLTGQLSSAAISLRAIADLTVSATPTVNALTTLQKQRLKTLMSQGMTYAAANTQSQTEVLAAFEINSAKVNSLSTFYSMRFTGSTDADSVLLATSAILSQMATDAATTNGTTQPAELSNYMNTIAAQLATTGKVTGSSFVTARNLAATEINLSTVRTNVETYYAKYGVVMVAPKFEEWIDKSGSGILPQRLVPVTGLAFTDASAASPGQLITSNVITIAGLGAGVIAPVVVSTGTTIIKNNAAVIGIYSEVQDGDTIAIRVTSPGYNETNVAAVSVGTTSTSWRVTSPPLSGTISGLTGAGLVLQNNGADNITIPSGSTSFSFPTAMANGSKYNVSVLVQPTAQLIQVCKVNNGSGTVGAAASNITLVCATPSGILLAADTKGGVWTYSIDPTTGALTVVGTNYSNLCGGGGVLGSGRTVVAVDARAKFIYLVNGGNSSVSGCTLNVTTGALTTIPGSPFAVGSPTINPSGFPIPVSVAVDPSGRFAYVASQNQNNFSAFTINGMTGALTAINGSPFAASTAPTYFAVDPTGKFAYVANATSNSVSAYAIDSSTGALSPVAGSPFAAGASPHSIAVDPTGRFVYVANSLSNNVSGYTIDTMSGALTSINGSPFAAGTNPNSVTVHPSGKFAYIADNNISAYAIDRATGVLTPIVGSPFGAGTQPVDVTVDPIGKFVFVANENSVSVYSIDAMTGALNPVAGSPFVIPFPITIIPFALSSIAVTGIP